MSFFKKLIQRAASVPEEDRLSEAQINALKKNDASMQALIEEEIKKDRDAS